MADLLTLEAQPGPVLDGVLSELLHQEEPRATAMTEASLRQGLPFVCLTRFLPEKEALATLSHEVARRLMVLPLFLLEERLYLAVVDPDNLEAQDYVREMSGYEIRPVLADREQLVEALGKHYLCREQSAEAMGALAARSTAVVQRAAITVEDEDAPIIKLVNYILTQAIGLGASDIHIEPQANGANLRYRVDGILHEFPAPPAATLRPLVSRIKIISNLDIADRRMPQDGRTTFCVNGKDYDLRVSVIPNVHGEGVVMRVLDTTGKIQDLPDVGMTADMMDRFDRILHQPYGMLLVVGPTGAGKSTTLYTALKRICSSRKKIVTLEDPVEVHLDGLTQIQIHPDIGFTFAHGLRAILRHDPDVVMLGEIRDYESAEIAVRASLTGHLLFSTLHTNNAPLALTRLVNMGLPSYLVLSSLLGVLAQRLVRRLCAECKKQRSPTAAELAELGLDALPAGATFCEPRGCAACSQLGYKGRIGIYEMLEVNGPMRRLSSEELTAAKLVECAGSAYTTLRHSAVQQLLSGTTSLEEVLSITTGDS